MYVSEYIDLFEQQQEDQGNPNEMNYGTDPGQLPDPFEQLKKYYLYSKIKEIRQKLEDSEEINKSDNKIEELFEYLDIILLFYNSLGYNDIVVLLNNFLDILQNQYNINLPVRDDANVLQDFQSDRMQQVQQGQQQAQQQELQKQSQQLKVHEQQQKIQKMQQEEKQQTKKGTSVKQRVPGKKL